MTSPAGASISATSTSARRPSAGKCPTARSNSSLVSGKSGSRPAFTVIPLIRAAAAARIKGITVNAGRDPDLPETKEELLLAVGHFPALGRRADVEVAEIDAPAGDVIGRDLERHAVARNDADMALAHLAAGIREHARAVRQRDAELRVRQHLLHGAVHLDELFFRHGVAQYLPNRTQAPAFSSSHFLNAATAGRSAMTSGHTR